MANPTKKKYNIGELFKCNNCDNLLIATEVIIRNHNYRCKKCRNAFIIKYQKANPDKIKQWDKNYKSNKSAKNMRIIANKKYAINNPEKIKSHWKVADAIIKGNLIKLPCEQCGEIKTQAHHEDYSKPLNVIWLCEICHKKRHKLLKQLSDENKTT